MARPAEVFCESQTRGGASSIAHYGTSVPYHFTGFLRPDSCCIDSPDNLNVAMYSEGRVMIFNPHGYPIDLVFIPGHETGQDLRTTYPMLVHGTRELIICANAGASDQSSWLYRTKGFAAKHRDSHLS